MLLVLMSVLLNYSRKNLNCVRKISGFHNLICWKYFLLIPFVFFNSAFAADKELGQTIPISSGQILNLITGLILVLVVFFCIAYILRRVSGMGGVSRGNIKIVDSLHLGTKERLVLVKVADTYMLLGVSAGNINPLHVINWPIN